MKWGTLVGLAVVEILARTRKKSHSFPRVAIAIGLFVLALGFAALALGLLGVALFLYLSNAHGFVWAATVTGSAALTATVVLAWFARTFLK